MIRRAMREENKSVFKDFTGEHKNTFMFYTLPAYSTSILKYIFSKDDDLNVIKYLVIEKTEVEPKSQIGIFKMHSSVKLI